MRVKELHALAYRRRAGMIAALQSCICAWPVEVEKTATGHSEACPAHRMLVYSAANPIQTIEKGSRR